MVTKQGVIRSELTEFDHPLQRGIIALGIDEGDELLAAARNGRTMSSWARMRAWPAVKESDVRPMVAARVRGMELEEGDYLVGVEIVEKDDRFFDCATTGKRTPLVDYRLTARGRKGVINKKTTPRVGKVVCDLSVKED
jgi:DNA gyrase subunit A